MKKKQDMVASLHATRLDALDSVRVAEAALDAARETFNEADDAWRTVVGAGRETSGGGAA